jgi:K+ transporter
MACPAMIGGAALLADGMITPPISVTSAIEGLYHTAFSNIQQSTIIYIVIGSWPFFFMQQFGTLSIGKLFGPIMLSWFSMLAVLGSCTFRITDVFKVSSILIMQLNSSQYRVVWLLGAVFLVQPVQRRSTATWGIAAGIRSKGHGSMLNPVCSHLYRAGFRLCKSNRKFMKEKH